MATDELPDAPVSIGRRDALKAAAATAAAAALPATAAASSLDAQPPARRTAAPRALPVVGPRGTPTDPDLINPKADWPRLLSAKELATLAVLCDLIIPADGVSPSASSVGAPA
jgi:gluconate 2-dehydrogenase gamma chain